MVRVEFCIVVLMAASVYAVEKPTTKTETCITAECHGERGKKAFVHGPISLGDCKSCHELQDAATHSFSLAREGKDLCEFCHLDQSGKLYMHEPLTKGDCLQCHESHESDNKALLLKESVAKSCEECHQVTENMTHLHGPTAVGECSVCHNAHGSDYEKLLTREPDKLCAACHEITMEEIEKFEFVHEPVRDNCVGCHNPHGANNWKMLNAEAPDMCFPCHEEIQQTAKDSKHQHNVVSEPGGCLKCHTPHASTVRFLLASEPTTLCMTCHDKPLAIAKDKVLPAFTDQLKDKQFLHGPIKDNDCSGCHLTHGSDHFRILAKEYPEIFYAPFDETKYDLCFGCHEKTLVWTAETEDLTDFRNGKQNLHFLHVNKARRGRTCRACHATHASNMPKHIRATVPYGVWDLPINFSKTETGGSCSPGCHIVKDYDRQTAVDYTVKKAEP